MAKKRYGVRNWKEYNRSLVNRGSLTFWFNAEVVKGWRSQKTFRGKGTSQYYSDTALLCALTLRQVFHLTLRATEGMLLSLIALLKLDVKVPDYTTLCRRSRTLKVPFLATKKEGPLHVLVDATGIRVVGEGQWKTLRHGKEKWQVWKKLHLAMDADNHMILSAQVSESERLDCNFLPDLLAPIKHPIYQVTGDGGYDKKCCYQAVHERGAKGVFPPQHNAIVQRNKYKKKPFLAIRDETIQFLAKSRNKATQLKRWKQQTNYHRRSLIETLMSRMKSLFGDQVRSKRMENQQTDLLIRCYAINQMNQLGLPDSYVIA